MERLKRLYLDNTGLTSLPPSVGQLRQLEVLSANKNFLSSLPVTLSFCENLRELNLKDNKLDRVPSVVLRLPHLKDLRRLGNPLPQLYHGFETPPHIKLSTPKSTKQTSDEKFNPGSLQSLCANAAFNHKIDYWTTGLCSAKLWTALPLTSSSVSNATKLYTIKVSSLLYFALHQH